MNTDDLARLMIYLAALVVWALSGRDRELYEEVRNQGTMNWEKIKEEAFEKP
jgi:hypothetical protein